MIFLQFENVHTWKAHIPQRLSIYPLMEKFPVWRGTQIFTPTHWVYTEHNWYLTDFQSIKTDRRTTRLKKRPLLNFALPILISQNFYPPTQSCNTDFEWDLGKMYQKRFREGYKYIFKQEWYYVESALILEIVCLRGSDFPVKEVLSFSWQQNHFSKWGDFFIKKIHNDKNKQQQ